MLEYTIFGKTASINDEAYRFYKMLYASTNTKEIIENEFNAWYNACGDIKTVLKEYPAEVYSLCFEIAANSLHKSLINVGIYDQGKDEFIERCVDISDADDAFNAVTEQYNSIVSDKDDAVAYRKARKKSRAKVGFMATDIHGMFGAAMDASVINMATGAAHGVWNSIGNAGSAISAAHNKRKLYASDATRELLLSGVMNCVVNCFFEFMALVNDEKDEQFYSNDFDADKADTLFENAQRVPEKEEELLILSFCKCPWNYSWYEYVFFNYPKERRNIIKMGSDFHIDFKEMLKHVFENEYDAEARNSYEQAQKAKSRILLLMQEYEVDDRTVVNTIDRDCLLRLCLEYDKASLNNRQNFVERFRSYDADSSLKRNILYSAPIWELATAYNVQYKEEDATEIIDKICLIECPKSEDSYICKLSYLRDAMKSLAVEHNAKYDEFEYEMLEFVANGYECALWGNTSSIVSCIRESPVSEQTKVKYIKDKRIWELFKEYRIYATPQEQYDFVDHAFRRMSNLSDSEKTNALTIVISSVDIAKSVDALSEAERIVLFDILSGITEFQSKHRQNINEENIDTAYEIIETAERFIKNTGITFMSSSLIYGDRVEEAVENLTYCTIKEEEHPLIIYDAHSVMHPFEWGFCFTDKRIIAHQEYEQGGKFEISVYDILSFEKKGLLFGKIQVNTQSGFKSLDVQNLQEITKLAECFNQILNAVKNPSATKQTALHKLDIELVEQCAECVRNSQFLVNYFSVVDYVESILAQNSYSQSDSDFPHGDADPAPNVDMDDNVNNVTVDSAAQTIAYSDDPKATTNNASQIPYVPITQLSKAELLAQLKDYPLYGCLAVGTEMFNKKIAKARTAYAPYTDDEIAYLMEDKTVFGSAKEGFVLTDKNLYVKRTLSNRECISLSQIERIISRKSGSLVYIYAVTNGTEHDISFVNSEDVARSFAEFLFAIITCLNTESPSLDSNDNPMQEIEQNKNGRWICNCGHTNFGKFCTECGCSKDNGNELWTCSCGATNYGKFCSECGAPKS